MLAHALAVIPESSSAAALARASASLSCRANRSKCRLTDFTFRLHVSFQLIASLPEEVTIKGIPRCIVVKSATPPHPYDKVFRRNFKYWLHT